MFVNLTLNEGRISFGEYCWITIAYMKWFSFHRVMNSFTLSLYIFQYVKIHSNTQPQLDWVFLIEEHPMQKVI